MIARFAKRSSLLILTAVLVACAGVPESGGDREAAQDNPERAGLLEGQSELMGTILSDLYDQGEWNAVLNLGRLGIVGIQENNLGVATKALDLAIERIDSVYADTESAKTARSLWVAEAVKDFKGEPHERALIYFYRGIVDLADEDYENARAMFRSAEYQDTLSETEEYQSDFALMDWLAGWSSQCINDESTAADSFARAREQFESRANGELQNDFGDWARQTMAARKAQNEPVEPSRDHRALVIMESGRGPVKVTRGKYNELLTYDSQHSDPEVPDKTQPSPVQDRHAGTRNSRGWMEESLSFQAMTRGGRQVDSVLAGKANFKDATNTMGNVTSAIGMSAMFVGAGTGDRDAMGVGAALTLIGVFAKVASAAATPTADTRGLPVPEFIVAESSPGINAVSGRGAADSAAGENLVLRNTGKKCSIELYRDQAARASLMDGEFKVNPLSRTELNRILQKNRERDGLFRAQIVNLFAKAERDMD